MEHRDARIIVETSRHRITGLLRLPANGYRGRLTDYLNSSEALGENPDAGQSRGA